MRVTARDTAYGGHVVRLKKKCGMNFYGITLTHSFLLDDLVPVHPILRTFAEERFHNQLQIFSLVFSSSGFFRFDFIILTCAARAFIMRVTSFFRIKTFTLRQFISVS